MLNTVENESLTQRVTVTDTLEDKDSTSGSVALERTDWDGDEKKLVVDAADALSDGEPLSVNAAVVAIGEVVAALD